MSHDQGAWDRINGISNTLRRMELAPDNNPTHEEFVALAQRVAELEQRFRDLKKAVWRV